MTAAPESWTVGRLLTWTTDYLARHGSATPRLDAELLLAHVRHCPRIGLYTHYGDEVDAEQRNEFKELIRRRARGEPVAYLIGRKEFYSLSFTVTPAVLIPRPETEGVLEAVLDRARPLIDQGRLIHLADVGTGSGVLAICAAKFLPNIRVTAIDISPETLEVARQNALHHGVADRIEFLLGDLLSCVPSGTRFDFVMSNPPYVSEAEYTQLPADVRRYEPRVALVAGPTGMEVIERLVADSPQFLQPEGWLIFEISPMLADRVERLFVGNRHWQHVQKLRDLAGQDRVVGAQYRPIEVESSIRLASGDGCGSSSIEPMPSPSRSAEFDSSDT